jgi:hypothetical protein
MEAKKFNNNKDWFFISEKLDALMNSLPVPPHTRKEFNDYDLYLFWTKLFTSGGGSSQLYANALFVDSAFGNNAGAVPFSLMDNTTNPVAHKYATIKNAVADATPGSVIIVYPGSYAEDINLYKNGVTFYFYPGASVVSVSESALFQSQANGQNCEVYGSGNFSNGSIGGVIHMNTESRIFFQCHDIQANSNPIQIGDGHIELYCNDLLCIQNAAVNIIDGTVAGASLFIEAHTIRNLSPFNGNHVINNVTGGPGYQGTAKIKAYKISSSPNAGNSILAFDNFIVPAGASFEIEADIFEPLNNTNGDALIHFFFNNNTKVVIKGNIDCTLFPLRRPIHVEGPNPGCEFIFIGDIIAKDQAVLTLVGSGQIMRMIGRFQSDAPDTMIVSGSNCVTYFDGEIDNHPIT